ncbi:MAG: Hpt domain-containing protein [Proteobacteria bacterium]|nr:Hpt domain-containing protein [Pseudomonadota bacterium]
MTELNNYLDEYVGECQEVLDRVSLNLARIEKNDGDPEIITSVYRDIHTIKGTSQLFGFQQMGQVAHAIESSLDPVRKGDRELLSAHTDVIFSAVDIMLRILNGIRSSKAEPDLKNGLAQLLDAILSISNVAQKSAKETPSTETGISQAGQGTTPQKDSPSLNAKLEDQQSDTIRIHVGLLDSLMNLTGELVLIRNQVAQLTRTIENNELHTISQRLNALTGELQNDVMKTRMQPIGAILNRFNRMVRDSAKDLGKSINLAIEGAETELDKTLIDAVKDPLTHIVRNSVDHGIESPETRRLNKKAPQ